MQNKKLKKLITIFFVLIIFSSCSRDYIVPDPPAAPPSPTENKISFELQILPIFDEKCVSCHGPGQTPPDLSNDHAYQALTTMPGMVDTITPGNSTLYKKMASGGSMAQYCTKANADSVYKWIRQGARHN
jgi:hypothetical protein